VSFPSERAGRGEEFTAEGQAREVRSQQISADRRLDGEEGDEVPAEAQAPLNDAERVRRHLAAARAAGVRFDEAWAMALAVTLPPVEGHPSSTAVRERREWRHALKSTRGAWQAAYRRVPESRAEAAARDLEELLAA